MTTYTDEEKAMKLWMLSEFGGTSEGVAFVWADDPEEARRLLKEKLGDDRTATVAVEVMPEKGVWALHPEWATDSASS